MKRSALVALLLLIPAATAATAAPVPKVVLTAEQEREFDQLWDAADGQVGRVRLYTRLIQQPNATGEYLIRHFPPAELSEKEAKRLLDALGSDDEKIWKRAYRDMCVRDVRLAMTLKDAWDLTSGKQRVRLGAVLYGRPSPNHIRGVEYYLGRPTPGTNHWRVGEQSDMPRVHLTNSVLPDYDDWAKHMRKYDGAVHVRATVAVAALERIGTTAARDHLTALGKGHAEASSTVEATAALTRIKKPAKAEVKSPDDVWKLNPLTFTRPAELNQFLAQPKEAVAFLKGKLRPLTLSKKDGERLLARLLGDDLKECRAALRELQTFDLRLAMTAEDAWKEAKTPTQRGRLVTALAQWQRLPELEIGEDFDPDRPHHHFDYTYYEPSDNLGIWLCVAVKREAVVDAALTPDENDWLRETPPLACTLDKLTYDRWVREESAVYILDAIGTDDAIVVIKDMATGHPDAGPTKAAKDILKRRGMK